MIRRKLTNWIQATLHKYCNDYYSTPHFPKIPAKSSKAETRFDRGSIFGSLKALISCTISEISRIYAAFADSDGITAWVLDTTLH